MSTRSCCYSRTVGAVAVLPPRLSLFHRLFAEDDDLQSRHEHLKVYSSFKQLSYNTGPVAKGSGPGPPQTESTSKQIWSWSCSTDRVTIQGRGAQHVEFWQQSKIIVLEGLAIVVTIRAGSAAVERTRKEILHGEVVHQRLSCILQITNMYEINKRSEKGQCRDVLWPT